MVDEELEFPNKVMKEFINDGEVIDTIKTKVYYLVIDGDTVTVDDIEGRKQGNLITLTTEQSLKYKIADASIENFEAVLDTLGFSNLVVNKTTENWTVHNYFIRKIEHLNEEIIEGDTLVLTINLHPNDFNVRRSMVETMNMFQLNDYIKEERMKGSKNLVFHIIEQQKRFAYPFATLILTIVAVAMASRKVRGGIGLHLGLGLLISFAYILFMQISTTFATNGDLSPIIAVWIPNLLFASLGLYLLKKAPK